MAAKVQPDHRRASNVSLSHPDRLLGRSAEESILLNSYFASLSKGQDCAASVILIHGDSGLGKTKLAETLRPHVVQDDGYFIQGKFDQLSYGTANRPYSGISSAFAQYCAAVEQRSEEDWSEVAEKLRGEIRGDEGRLLLEAIPSLGKIVGRRSRSSRSSSRPPKTTAARGEGAAAASERRHSAGRSCPACRHGEEEEEKVAEGPDVSLDCGGHRFVHLIKRVASVMSNIGDPIVFLIDDIQWANKTEIDVLRAIMSGAINPFMFIFTCRPGSHPFLEVINEYDGKTEIALQSLTRNSVRQFVAEMLMLDDVEDCTELANFISRVTNGNPFFIQQQLVSLRDEGLIRFGNHGYVWNIDEIEQIHGDLSGDVVAMLSEKMKRLPSVTQQALKICACIGSTVDADILGLLIRETLTVEGSESQDNEALAKMAIAPASQEGLLAEIEGGRGLTFTHDSVNEAAHLLLEPDLEANFHLTLGLILQKNVCPNLFRKYLFTIAAQLSRGIKLIVTKEDRVAAADIFLNAGEKSKAASAFPEAHFFFKKGNEVLREEDWATDYRLFCDLYMKAADTAALTGDFKHMEECLAIVFSHCEGFLVDFLNASFIKARAMASRDDPEALDVGLEALRLAGEKFPTRNHAVHSLLGLVRTRRLMKAKGATALFQLPPIADRQMAATRRLLSLVQNIAPTVDQRLIPLLIFRSIQLNLKHGFSTTTPSSVASYAVLLSRLGFPLTEAVKYGEIALELQEKHNKNGVIPAVTYGTYGLLFPLVKSLSDCVKPLRAGYDAGAKSGDTAQAMSCATVMTWMLFFSGMRLSKVSHYLDKYRQSMSEHNMTRSLHQNRIYRNVVDFCLGASNASKFFCEDGDGATASTESTKTNVLLQQQSKFTQLVVACLFSDSGMAWAMSEKLDEFRSLYAGTIWPYICSFYRGMAASAMSSSSRQSRGTAKSCLKHLRKGRKKGVANLSHQLFLLEAEYAASRKKYASAEKFYSRSIEHAAQAGVTHEHALACEKFGSYHIMRKNHDAAYEQIREAHRLYLKWGARPKCEQLEKKYPRLDG